MMGISFALVMSYECGIILGYMLRIKIFKKLAKYLAALIVVFCLTLTLLDILILRAEVWLTFVLNLLMLIIFEFGLLLGNIGFNLTGGEKWQKIK